MDTDARAGTPSDVAETPEEALEALQAIAARDGLDPDVREELRALVARQVVVRAAVGAMVRSTADPQTHAPESGDPVILGALAASTPHEGAAGIRVRLDASPRLAQAEHRAALHDALVLLTKAALDQAPPGRRGILHVTAWEDTSGQYVDVALTPEDTRGRPIVVERPGRAPRAVSQADALIRIAGGRVTRPASPAVFHAVIAFPPRM